MSVQDRLEWIRDILTVICGISFLVAAVVLGKGRSDDVRTRAQQQELRSIVDMAAGAEKQQAPQAQEHTEIQNRTEVQGASEEVGPKREDLQEETPLSMLPEYELLYSLNSDMIGWLRIEGTRIDYPVMQTPSDPYYYLRRDFYGESNSNGCLFADPASEEGVGKAAFEYREGTAPGTNLMIYGHHMRSREMFGELDLYATREYGLSHSVIWFDTLYEHREYALLAVFRTQIYHTDEDVFKYYQFFRADTEEQFRYYYDNIRSLSLYDTGVEAQFGDELITLSTCDSYTENGRFVVVGKRIKAADGL